MAWLGSWNKRIPITVDSTKIDSNLTHFPIPIFLGTSVGISGKDVSDIFDTLGANSKKIAVTKDDGTTEIYVEIEQWDNGAEKGVLHISKSDLVLSSSTDTTLYLYYDNNQPDNTTYVAEVGSRTEVWDSNHKAVWHLRESGNGSVGEYVDSTSNNHDGQGGEGDSDKTPTQVDAKIGKGQDCDGNDYIGVPDSSDWDLGTSDFTLSLKVKFDSVLGFQNLLGRHTSAGSYFYFAKENGLRFRDLDGVDNVDMNNTWPGLTTGVFYDLEVTRNGNDFKYFIDGTQLGSTVTTSNALANRSSILQIGGHTGIDYWLNGVIDEVRWSVGLDRGQAWRDARIDADDDDFVTFGDVETQPEDGLVLSDEIEIVGTRQLSFEETITLEEGSKKIFSTDETITLDDRSNQAATLYQFFSTKLNTLLAKTGKFMTNLTTKLITTQKYSTKLNTMAGVTSIVSTDLRVRYDDYDSIDIGTLNDFIVKLDGSELTDVDYNTLNITFSLNSTPSRATCVLARRHDNLNKKLDGTTSQITNENKIEVFDGSTKLFTGYITEIHGDSSRDVVEITAEDARYKISKVSMELEYGGKYEQDETDPNVYTRFEKNVSSALSEVISQISSYISGYDASPFSGAHVPEYVKVYNNCALLLDDLVKNTANANWYLDENERLRYQKVGQGTIKTLNLSSFNSHRHAYDTILSNVTLNRKSVNYAQSLNVKRGKDIKRTWARRTFSGWLTSIPEFLLNLVEKTIFCFQQWGETGQKWYCGINVTIYGYFANNGWVLKPTLVIQYQSKDEEEDLADITVGSGSPRRTVYFTNYGKKEANARWEERIRESDQKAWLVSVTEDNYDYTAYAQDLANFELSQNNQLMTSATVTLLLDAYKYYNIKMSNRVNLDNTVLNSIYRNSNGFPLNIDSMSINCATRVVTLNLTNYGKTWREKTANYLTNYVTPQIVYKKQKQPVVRFTQGT